MFRRLVIAGAFGAAAMYFLDPINGVQRRVYALQALDARLKQLNTALSGSGKRAITASPPPTLAMEADQGAGVATDRLAAVSTTATSRAKTVKRAAARTAKKTEQQA